MGRRRVGRGGYAGRNPFLRPGGGLLLAFLCGLVVLIVEPVQRLRCPRRAATVEYVVDGDTVDVRWSDDGTGARVRLWGVDAPESRQAFGPEARAWLSGRAAGVPVVVRIEGKDGYGRTVGELLTDGASVNGDLVAAGLAWWYRRYAPGAADLWAAEGAACRARRGLWSVPDPVRPADRQRAKERAEDWLAAVLPKILPPESGARLLGPAPGGRELLGPGWANIVPTGQIVSVALVIEDGTSPAQPPPAWLIDGLKERMVEGVRFLGVGPVGSVFLGAPGVRLPMGFHRG